MEETIEIIDIVREEGCDYPDAAIQLLIPNYNSIDFIDGFLKSLGEQTLRRFDVTFLKIKGSTDESWDRIGTWSVREGVVLRRGRAEFRTIFGALNMAANMALSKNENAYICPVNISDRFTKAGLQTLADYAERQPDVDVFYPNFKIVNDKEHKNIVGYQNWPEYTHKNLLQENICGCSPLIKGRTFLEAESYWDQEYKYAADYDLYLRLALDNKKFQLIKEVVGSHYEGEMPTELLESYNKEIEEIQTMHTPFSFQDEE